MNDMVYCLNPDNYPKMDQSVEVVDLSDLNSFEWQVSRVKNGLFVRFLGDKYFMDDRFMIETINVSFPITNTNCIFFEDEEFETYYHMRELIKKQYTDDIWESIEELLNERFANSAMILKSETSIMETDSDE